MAGRCRLMTLEAQPNVERVFVLANFNNPLGEALELQVLIERQPNDLEKLFAAARASQALVVGDDTEFTAYRAQWQSWP